VKSQDESFYGLLCCKLMKEFGTIGCHASEVRSVFTSQFVSYTDQFVSFRNKISKICSEKCVPPLVTLCLYK